MRMSSPTISRHVFQIPRFLDFVLARYNATSHCPKVPLPRHLLAPRARLQHRNKDIDIAKIAELTSQLEQKEKELLREIKQQCKIGLAAGTITKSDLLNKIRELIAQKGPGVPAPNEVSRLRIKSKKLTT